MENCINLVMFPWWLQHIPPLTSLSATFFLYPLISTDSDFYLPWPIPKGLVGEIRIQPDVISAGTRFLACFSHQDSLDML